MGSSLCVEVRAASRGFEPLRVANVDDVGDDRAAVEHRLERLARQAAHVLVLLRADLGQVRTACRWLQENLNIAVKESTARFWLQGKKLNWHKKCVLGGWAVLFDCFVCVRLWSIINYKRGFRS